MKKLDADPSVGCIVFTGGKGRSFCAGGDFKETCDFTGGDEIDRWLDDVTGLYTTIAGISTSVIAAIDGYAVGLGLQIALCCDYRIGSDTCYLMMPEFKVGIACNCGGYLLEAVIGRSVMQKMLFTCDRWSAQDALKDGLLHEVVPSKDLAAKALERAQIIASWEEEAVQGTRTHINARLVSGINALGDKAKQSHRAAFSTGKAQVNMKQIITKSQNQSQDQLGAPSWILLTNQPVPSLGKTLKKTNGSGVHTYGEGAALSAKDFSWLENDDVPAKKFSEWATSFEIKGDVVRIRTGAMNDPPLYMVRNTTTRAWALGTDAFTLHIVRSQWGMPVGFVDPTVINRDETTSFMGVSQLPAHSSITLRNADLGGWAVEMSVHPDPILAALNPQISDFKEAGSAFIRSLQSSISELTFGEKSVATLLSGGIDSGAVTTFAVLAGLNVTAYSAGSPWGNEHAEAAELAEFLGIKHVKLDFSAEELLDAAPESMRALGTAEQERVDIALTITACMRSGAIKEPHVLTGYGNDLLNLGLPPDSRQVEDLIQEIIDGVDITRHSGEFTDYVARVWGKKLSHPYWHKDVIQTALDIKPLLKVQGGREKAYFRAAMEPFVPESTAWRIKIGIHLGGGLQGGLDAMFGGREGKVAAYHDAFKAITARLLVDPFANILDLKPKVAQINGNGHTNGHTNGRTNGSSSPSKALLPTGAGFVIDGAFVADEASLASLVKNILAKITEARFILVRNLSLSEDKFKWVSNTLGNPVNHKFQTGSSELMKLPATRDKGNVVLGRGMLPVHTDGLFTNNRPDLIMLYAAEFSDLPGSGETTVVDQVAAMKELPKELIQKLESVEFEYKVVESGHHMQKPEDKWFSVPPITTAKGRKCLGVSLQFPPGTETSWLLRIKGWSDEGSTALLKELDDFVYQERYLYQHPWKVGDLLVMDNYGTLHGRTAISEKGERCLYRGQVNRRDMAAT